MDGEEEERVHVSPIKHSMPVGIHTRSANGTNLESKIESTMRAGWIYVRLGGLFLTMVYGTSRLFAALNKESHDGPGL